MPAAAVLASGFLDGRVAIYWSRNVRSRCDERCDVGALGGGPIALARALRQPHVGWVNGAIDDLRDAPSDERDPPPDEALDEEIRRARSETRAEANRMIGMGVGIGALGAATAFVAGAVCPACVVAASALVGLGLYRRRRARGPRRSSPR